MSEKEKGTHRETDGIPANIASAIRTHRARRRGSQRLSTTRDDHIAELALAKRYKNTVGVSAVRDLFGTMQNEGASKGILVTTSGYGQSSYEFANGEPLELLDGSNLLYLLAEHAGVEARIEAAQDWQDPVASN